MGMLPDIFTVVGRALIDHPRVSIGTASHDEETKMPTCRAYKYHLYNRKRASNPWRAMIY